MPSKLQQSQQPTRLISNPPPYNSLLELPVVMSTLPRCPKCKKLTLNEREDSLSGIIHHECSSKSCGYFMIWSSRQTHYGLKPGEPAFPITDVIHARWLNVENNPRYVTPTLPTDEEDWNHV